MGCADDIVLRLRDNDGTVAELSVPTHNIGCSVNTDYENVGGTIYPSFTVITLTISAPPTIITQGTTPGLQVPATVLTRLGSNGGGGDEQGNLAGSGTSSSGTPIAQ